VTTARITLVGKPGCHLCDDAREAVHRIRAGYDTSYEELSILDDTTLFEEYAEEIPVVLINDRVHTIWRVDPTRLTQALTEATA
jgi:glutaredoxin